MGLLLGFGPTAARADSYCGGPIDDSPAAAFTVPSFRPGELDTVCGPAIGRAKAAGFTSVVLIPAFVYDRDQARLLEPTATLAPGELARCLDLAARAGLSIVYQPHLESLADLYPNQPTYWRGTFDFRPGPDYRRVVFNDYLTWLAAHAPALRDAGLQMDVVIAAELERSTTRYPAVWTAFSAEFRQALRPLDEAGLHVRIGINPNWYPEGTLSDAAALDRFVSSVDFVAPSFYGDWSRVDDPDQVGERKRGMLDALTREASPLGVLLHINHVAKRPKATLKSSTVPAFKTKPFAIGEFASGADLQNSQSGVAIQSAESRDGAVFRERRRKLYENMLRWAKGPDARSSPPLYLNIWTLGVFDPVGVQPAGDVAVDPDIVRMIREYSASRCPGLVRPSRSSP